MKFSHAGERYLSPSRPIFRTKWASNTNIEVETASTESLFQATDRRSLSTVGLTRLSDLSILLLVYTSTDRKKKDDREGSKAFSCRRCLSYRSHYYHRKYSLTLDTFIIYHFHRYIRGLQTKAPFSLIKVIDNIKNNKRVIIRRV